MRAAVFVPAAPRRRGHRRNSVPPRRRRIEASPLTGKTHQIRVHASAHGFPILGDTLYGGTPAPRLFLHAARLTLEHPATGQKLVLFRARRFRRRIPASRCALPSSIPR